MTQVKFPMMLDKERAKYVTREIAYEQTIDNLHQRLAKREKQIVMLRNALIRIESWNSHSISFAVDYGSSGVRDFYIEIAKEALAAADDFGES